MSHCLVPAFPIVRAFAGGFVDGRRPAEDGGPGVFRISLPDKHQNQLVHKMVQMKYDCQCWQPYSFVLIEVVGRRER